MSWRDRPMAGFDTETTSVDPETARIVTASVGLATQTGWSARNWMLRQPDGPIPAGATAIHGITTEQANTEGEDPREAVALIRDDLYKAWSMGMAVVVFNAPYDCTLLDRECRRLGLGEFEVRGPIIDPLVLERETDPDKYLKRDKRLARLSEIYAALGIEADPAEDASPGWYTLRITYYRVFGRDMEGDAHGAEADAYAACHLAWKIGARRLQMEDYSKTGDGARWLTLSGARLSDLQQLQAEAYRSQRVSFGAWLARQGRSLDDPSTDWPMRPWQAATEEAA